jgi:hypothetical protein
VSGQWRELRLIGEVVVGKLAAPAWECRGGVRMRDMYFRRRRGRGECGAPSELGGGVVASRERLADIYEGVDHGEAERKEGEGAGH